MQKKKTAHNKANETKNANVTADRAMEMIGISTADRSKYKAKLSS